MNASFVAHGTQTSTIGNDYLFTGRRFDPETGMYYFRNRYYHAQLGRFATTDPLRYVDGGSLYRAYFVPGRVDPSGLCPTWGSDLIPPQGWIPDCAQVPEEQSGGWYGCYCGKGNPPPQRDRKGGKLEAIDTMDAICEKHDACYGAINPPCNNVTEWLVTTWDGRKECNACDKTFCQALSDLDCTDYPPDNEEGSPYRVCLAYRYAAMFGFRCEDRFQIKTPSFVPPRVVPANGK